MAINCVICGRRQSGMLAHYPLSKEDQDDRICLSCSNHLKRMLATTDSGIFRREKDYFQNFFFGDQITDKARQRLEYYFDLARFMTPDTSLNTILKDEKLTDNSQADVVREEDLEDFMVTNGHHFEGYRIRRYLDVISQERILALKLRNWFRGAVDMFSYLTDDEVEEIAIRIEEEREAAKAALYRQAIRLGANALTGLTFESEITSQAAAIRVSVWGTAVLIEKLDIK